MNALIGIMRKITWYAYKVQQINEIESNPINYFEQLSVDLSDP